MIRASTTPSIAVDLALDRLGDRAGLQQVLRREADVDRRRLAFVHRRADHAAGVEGELQVAEPGILGQPVAELLDVFLGRVLALVLELDLDDRVHRPGVGGVGGRQVGDHAQLGDDDLQVLADRLADELLDLGDLLLGLLDPRAAGCAGVDLEGAESTSGKNSRRSWLPRPTSVATSRPTATSTTVRR